MKTISYHGLAKMAAIAALACTSVVVSAQETVVTTTGTISSLSPSEVVVQRETGSPFSYRYTKQTTFVDSEGRTISYETIKPGEPTTVYYTMVGGQPVVQKVLVTRKTTTTPAKPAVVEETTTTTTTTKKDK